MCVKMWMIEKPEQRVGVCRVAFSPVLAESP
jgi:hypothetical protein